MDEQRDVTAQNAPDIALPATAKAQWLQALRQRANEMVYSPDGGETVIFTPVNAGATLGQVVPIRWLGDYIMAYIPDLGHWAPARSLLTQILTEFVPALKPTFGMRQAKDILEHAGVLSPDFTNRDQPNVAELIAKTWDAKPYITFRNGDLYVPTMQIEPHDPAHMTTWSVPWDWDPNAQSAKLDRFLKSAIPDAVGRKNFLAFIGYALARFDTSQHMFVYLVGHGSNGKSLSLKLIRSLFGAYWSNTSLGKLVGSRFGAANLVFSALNFVGDQDAIFLATTELLKELTAFDAIEAEKKFRDAFPFIAKTKFMFAVNALPKTKDVSYGFFRRPLIIEFPNQFAQNPQYERYLLDDDGVCQALAVQAMAAYRDMLKHSGFWIEGRTKELIEEYRADNDVVYAAVKDGLIYADPNAKIAPWSLAPVINLFGAELEKQKLSQSAILERLGLAGIRWEKHRESHGARRWMLHGIGIHRDMALELVGRASTIGIDGQPVVHIGGRRIGVAKLLAAWGFGAHATAETIADPDIAHALGAGGGDNSTWL